MRSIILAGAIAAAMISAPARAAEINFGTVLTDLDGQPLKEGEKVLTLGRASMMALTIQAPDQAPPLTGDEKFRRGNLAVKVYTDAAVDLTAEDVALIKKQIGSVFNPIVIMRAFPLLDPPAKK